MKINSAVNIIVKILLSCNELLQSVPLKSFEFRYIEFSFVASIFDGFEFKIIYFDHNNVILSFFAQSIMNYIWASFHIPVVLKGQVRPGLFNLVFKVRFL